MLQYPSDDAIKAKEELNVLQARYEHLQELCCQLSRMVVQMHEDRRYALALEPINCHQYMAFEARVLKDPGKEAMIAQIGAKVSVEAFFGSAKEREDSGWIDVESRCPGSRPNEWSRKVLVEFSTGELGFSRYLTTNAPGSRGKWGDLPSIYSRVVRWHELPIRETVAGLAGEREEVGPTGVTVEEDVVWVG